MISPVAQLILILLIGAGLVTPAMGQVPPVFARPAEAELPAASAIRLTPAASATLEVQPAYEAALTLIDSLPAEDFLLDPLAKSFQGDPVAAFAFVRDRIAFDAYAGVMRGAEGTLGARAGNAYDRALLLKTLLERMGRKARLALGNLDDGKAGRVFQRGLSASPRRSPGEHAAAIAKDLAAAVEARARRDYARLRAAIGDAASAGRATENAEALAELKQHVWVQLESDGAWIELDPTFADAAPGDVLVPAQTTFDAPPVSDFVTVDLTVRIETLEDDQLAVRPVLTHRFRVADDAPRQVFFLLGPPGRMGQAIANAFAGTASLVPMLMIDGEATVGEPVTLAGAGGDAAIGALGGETGGSELVSVTLEFETHGPGMAPVPYSRTLLDRLPAESRSKAPVPEVLDPLATDAATFVSGTIHQIILSNGGTNARERVATRMIALALALRSLERSEEADFGYLVWPLAAMSRSVPAVTDLLAMDGLDGAGLRAYIARPHITLVSSGRSGPKGDDVSLDLLANPVRFVADGSVPSAGPYRSRMWLGVLSTALESEFVARIFAGMADASLSGVAFEMDKALTLFGPDAPPPPAAPPLMKDSARHLLVVVPGEVSSAKSWWTIDPDSGQTRSVLAPGLGGAAIGIPLVAAGGAGGGPPIGGLPRGNGGAIDLSKEWSQMNRPQGAAPANTCKPANEYSGQLTCASVPGSWSLGSHVGGATAAIAVGVAAIIGALIGAGW
jgi:hypothetical protein